MRRLSAIVLLFLTAIQLRADFHPTVSVARPEYSYSKTAKSLREIDFRNFLFRIFDSRGNAMVLAPLHRGNYDSGLKEGRPNHWVRLDWVKFLDSNSEYAAVGLSWVETGGSASDYGVVQVLTLHDKHPVVTQQLTFNTRGCQKARASLDPVHRVLSIRGVHGWEHCCPTTLDVLSYSWIGSGFEQRAAKSIPMPPDC